MWWEEEEHLGKNRQVQLRVSCWGTDKTPTTKRPYDKLIPFKDDRL